MAVRFAKYYKMLFLGLLDMALVNAYIVHREYCKSIDERPLSHLMFRKTLHGELVNLKPEDLWDVRPRDISHAVITRSPGSAAGTVTSHTLTLSMDSKPSGGHRYRVCKVCSVLHGGGSTKSTTRWFCKECSSEKGQIFLCNSVQREDDGNQLTCFQIWHQLWKNGTERHDGTTIRYRQNAGNDDDRHSEVIGTPMSVFTSTPVSTILSPEF
jgi:hypothetical protein